jgi:hypothetical protein
MDVTQTDSSTVIHAAHRFEARARLRKVLRLVETLDAFFRRTGDKQDAAMLATRLREWTESDWTTLARYAGVNLPSDEARLLVIGVFDDRATRGTVIDVEREEDEIANDIANRRGWEIGQ